MPDERPINDQPVTNYFSQDNTITPSSPIEPTPGADSVPSVEAMPPVEPPVKKSPKFTKVGVLVAVVAVILAGGASYAACSWYENPQKVLADSLVNTILTDKATYNGNISLDAGTSGQFAVSFNGQKNDMASNVDNDVKVTLDGKQYNFKASVVLNESGDVYLKVANTDSIISGLKSAMGITAGSKVNSAIDNFVKKVDGTWIKITSEDTKSYSEAVSKSQQCVSDTVKKYKNDKTAINEATAVYQKDQFVVVSKQLGQKDGDYGYTIDINKKAYNTFTGDVKNTKIYKSLHDCDNTFTLDEISTSADQTSGDKGTLNVWINMWTHKLAKVELNGTNADSKLIATINFGYDKVSTVATPPSSITLKDLANYMQPIYDAYVTPTADVSYTGDLGNVSFSAQTN